MADGEDNSGTDTMDSAPVTEGNDLPRESSGKRGEVATTDHEGLGTTPAQADQVPDDDKENCSPRPASKSTGRVPTMSSRAAFSRTPGNILTPGPDGDTSLPLDESQGVLITELQHQASDTEENEDEDRVSVVSKQDPEGSIGTPAESVEGQIIAAEEDHPHAEVVTVRTAEDDYDTDLEIEEEVTEEVIKSYYKTTCEQLGLVPVEYFLRHINDPNVRMRYRGLGPDATRAIALALKDSITIERFDIGGNWIGTEGAKYMSRLLEENDYITDVGMAENKIGSEGGLLLAKMIHINGGLRRLDLSGNEFDDKCAEAFSAALENNKYLREFSLSHNKFSGIGAEYLGPAISANENIDHLDLSWNHLRERGGIAVAKGIKENVRLKTCNLSWNGLDARGGLAIADAMMVNQSLLELDISGNRLTLEVAMKMAKVLTVNDTLKILKMGNNLITSAGAIALASAINNTDNCEIEELDLTDVPVEYEFLRTVEDIKTNRPNFRVKHGPIMRAGNTIEDLSKPAVDLEMIKKEPVVILKEHIIVNDMRLLDILRRYDEDESLSVTAEDFVKALEELAVPYDKKRLEDSVKKFAATATGKIYFGSFVKEDYNKSKPATQKES